ncbi:MFS transporter [Haloarchaeobius sp. TZWSO28]|uniref:MFS transporter n=1 Tax=Haloarchaeobius sp. TZWSO28 TaxID=3446119 RepID=UPI003EC04902
MRSRRVWTVVLFAFVAGHGVIQQSMGALLPSFEEEFLVTQELLGMVGPAATLGLLLTVMIVGMRSGALDIKRMLVLGTAGTIVASLVISVTSSFAALLLFLFLQGASVGTVRALDRPLLSHLYPNRRGRMFNLYALLWAVGATTGPLFVNAVLASADWRAVYALVGLALVPLLVGMWRLDLPAESWSEETISLGALRTVLEKPAVIGMVAALVCSGAIEGTVFTWLPFYASQFMPRESANVLLSSFLVMYIPARLAYSVLVDRVGHLDIVAIVGLASLPLLVVAFVLRIEAVFFPAVMGLGLFVAGFFPTLSAFGVDTTPEYSGPVNAIATGANFFGITAGPFVVGILAGRVGITEAMQVIVPIMASLVAIALLTRLSVERTSQPTGSESV